MVNNLISVFWNLVFKFLLQIWASLFAGSTVLLFVKPLPGISSILLSMGSSPIEMLFLKESYCLDFFLILIFLHGILHILVHSSN